jgi:hypothetical protein
MQSNPVAPSLQRPLYCVRRQSVDCYVLPLNGDHLRTRPRLLLYFLIGLGRVPQTREPTAALPNPTVSALRKPVGSGGTMSWWCRGLKPVEGRAACVLLLSTKKILLEHLSYSRQDYVCRGFWQVVHTYSGTKKERGECRPSPTQKCCVRISFVSARQGRVGKKCRHLAVRPTFWPAKLNRDGWRDSFLTAMDGATAP